MKTLLFFYRVAGIGLADEIGEGVFASDRRHYHPDH
jgi:hypothetical protein